MVTTCSLPVCRVNPRHTATCWYSKLRVVAQGEPKAPAAAFPLSSLRRLSRKVPTHAQTPGLMVPEDLKGRHLLGCIVHLFEGAEASASWPECLMLCTSWNSEQFSYVHPAANLTYAAAHCSMRLYQTCAFQRKGLALTQASQ